MPVCFVLNNFTYRLLILFQSNPDFVIVERYLHQKAFDFIGILIHMSLSKHFGILAMLKNLSFF